MPGDAGDAGTWLRQSSLFFLPFFYFFAAGKLRRSASSDIVQPGSTKHAKFKDEKTQRHNIARMWEAATPTAQGQETEGMRQLDRMMVAFHRMTMGSGWPSFCFSVLPHHHSGRVAYRRLIGMHGGGGGCADAAFGARLAEKARLDLQGHYNDKFPDNYWWPEPVPNSAPPMQYRNGESPFTYTFCWHAEPQFIVWHRPFVAELERLLQDHDPNRDPDGGPIHSGPDALGVPYWAWESWDGLTLPFFVTMPTYTLKTSAWESTAGFSAGDILPNPFLRWFAPVSVADQVTESFPAALNDRNCTTRAASFADPNIPHTLPWPITDQGAARPSMRTCVQSAMRERDYLKFATMKPHVGGGAFSIENAHNKLHNRIGGHTIGGVMGPGKQRVPPNMGGTLNIGDAPDDQHPFDFFTGTMAQNESVFDPIFWLHHSNVERQLCSWQNAWAPGGKAMNGTTPPPSDVMATKLFPWTKPDSLAQGKCGWETPSGPDDASFQDWWEAELTYEYDEYLMPTPPPSKFLTGAAPEFIYITAHVASKYRGGEFAVLLDAHEEVASLSVLSAFGSGCAKCQSKQQIEFQVHATAQVAKVLAALDFAQHLVLTRNGDPVAVSEWKIAEKMRGVSPSKFLKK